jgi:O-antigen/teichoic acid export membrane protein
MATIPAKKTRFVQNILSNWALVLFITVTNFFLSPFVVHRLGDSAYGIWVLLGSIVGYLGLIEFGVRGAVTRYIARYFATDDHLRAGRIASVALRLFFLSGVVAAFLAITASLVIENLFDIPSALLGEAQMGLCIIGISLGISMIGGVFGGIIAGAERFDILNGTEVVTEVVRVVFVVCALTMGYSLIALAVIQLCCSLLRAIGQAMVVRQVYPQLRLTLTVFKMQDAWEILSFGMYSSLLSLSARLKFFTDAIVISSLLPVAFVTLFSVGAMLTQRALSLSMGISTVLTPRVSALAAREEWDLLRLTFLRMGRISSMIMLPITITFLIRGPSFIELWMGPKYAEPSGEILRVLAVSLSFAAGARVVGAAMLGLNRHRQLVPAELAEAVLNLALSIILIGPLSITGVALGTAIPNLLMSLVVLPWYAQRVIGVKMMDLFSQFWFKPLLAMVPFAAVIAVLEYMVPTGSLLVFFVQIGAALPVAALGVFVLGLSDEERMFVRAKLRAGYRWKASSA